MNKLLRLGMVAVLMLLQASGSSGAQQHASKGPITDKFVGAWRLVWLEEPDAEGKIHKADCTGLLVYTSDRHMSVQVMYRNPEGGSPAAPVQYAQGGYEASFGRYDIDDARTFTYHVEGALARTLIGKDLKRVYALNGRQLIVNSPDPNEHWRVAWERY